jgi:hypothetical protein
MAHDDETRTRSLAMNQARFRYSNERLRRTAAHVRFKPSDRVPFLCECADRDCFEVVMLSLEEYDRLRRHELAFFVAGHKDHESTHERIVEAEDGYAIVEKIDAGTEAARLHLRYDDRSG